MSYQCEICNYSTDVQSNHLRHNRSDKHKLKVKENKKISHISHMVSHNLPKNDSKIICQNCGAEFSHKSSLSKHKHRCKHRNDTDEQCNRLDKMEKLVETLMEKTEKLTEENKKLTIEKIEMLEKNEKYLKSLVNNAGNIVQSSMNVAHESISALKYAEKCFNNAPLFKFNNIEPIICTTDNGEDLLNLIFIYENPNKIAKIITNRIVDYYKKVDPTLQTIWSCDTARLHYIVRSEAVKEIKEDGPIKIMTNSKANKKIIGETDNKKLVWSYDKNGTKLRLVIIKPLFEYIDFILDDYMKGQNEELEKNIMKLSNSEVSQINNNLMIVGNVRMRISDGSMENEIVKLMAPPLFLDTKMSIKLEEDN